MKTFTTFSIATSLLASTVAAQQQYAIDPNSVQNSTRDYWCEQQTTECPLICLQTAGNSATTESNECDSQALTYSCVCSNGLSPNISEYSQTLPYFICTEWGTQCVSNCNGDASCQSSCTQDHPCGALNPTKQNTSTLTSTMSKTATATGTGAQTTDSDGQTVYSGLLGATSTGGSGSNNGNSNSNSNGGSHSSGASTLVRVWALTAGQTFGTIGLIGAFVGGIAIVL